MGTKGWNVRPIGRHLNQDMINNLRNAATNTFKAYQKDLTVNTLDELVKAHLNLPSTVAICECGADKVYGENNSTVFHSSWCPKGKE